MANEIIVTAKGKIEPDGTGFVKRTSYLYPDWITGEDIPAKSNAYTLMERYGHKLYKRYVSVATYQELTRQHPELTP